MEGLSAAASVIAVIEISAKVMSLCLQYSAAVKNAKKDIEHLQSKVADLGGILGEVDRLFKTPHIKLPTTQKLEKSLKDCLQRLKNLEARLNPGNTRKTMSRLGVRALKWPFTSKEVHEIDIDLGRYIDTFNLALQVDQTGVLFDLDQKIDFATLPIAKGASFDSHMDEHNARCLENTRVELQRHITEWAKNKNGKPIFWLNGMAGTGKSTIARTVAQSFADKGQLGASFFFKKGEGERGNATRFFTTIATDLMSCIPASKPTVKKAIDDDPRISEKILKTQFEKLVLQPLSKVPQASLLPTSELVIVIDALDECEQEEDIRTILQLLARLKDIKSVSIKVFLTSRPEFDIRSSFKQLSERTYQDLILHEASEPTIKKDIALFLKDQFMKMRRAQSELSPDWPSEDQIQVLTQMAIPLFIFAATVCRYVGDKRGNPVTRLDGIMQSANQISNLDRIYLPILNQLLDDEDEIDKERWTNQFREIVGGIVIMKSPLSITSLGHLLDTPKRDISFRLQLLHSVLDIPTDEKRPIRLLHLSFRDFLLDPHKHGKSPFWIDKRKTHENLASKCLQLMSSPKGLRQNICHLSQPGILRSEIDDLTIDTYLQPEIRYACRYWVYHLQHSEVVIRDNDSKVYDFLQEYFLYWLEAMSLIREASESIRIIISLQLLIDADEGTKIAGFLYDAKRFALQNRSILENTPLQLYSSALIFAPEMSIVRKKFISHIPKWTTRLSKVDSNWKALLQTLEGHSGSVNTVAISSGGQLIASGSDDNTIRLWDVTTGSHHSTFEGHSGFVGAVTFSPDSHLVASGSDDKTVRLWDVTTGSCHNTLEGHSSHVRAVTFSPDSHLVASGSGDKTVRLWDVTTGSCHSTFEGHSSWVAAVDFSPNGQLIASGSQDNTIRLWDVTTRSHHSTLEGHSSFVEAVTFSPDSHLVASGSDDKTVRLWDVTTGSCHNTLEGHSSFVEAVTFSPDSHLVASGSGDKTVRLWDVTTGSCHNTFEGHSYGVTAVVFSPNGQLVVSGSADATVRLWDMTTESCSSTLEGHSSDITAVVFSPNGQLVASMSDDQTVRLWDVTTGSCHSTLEGHPSLVTAVVFSPNGQLIASGSQDNTIRLWDVTAGSCHTLEGHSNFVRAVVFSPNSQLVASGSDDLTVRLWDVTTGSCHSTLEGHSSHVRAVVFSPNSQLVASGSDDKTVRLWDVTTGSCDSTLEGHSSWVQVVVFSPNSQLVASGSRDKTVRLWDVTSGSCYRTLQGHSNWVTAVVFSPDGQLIASGSDDQTVRLWDVTSGSCSNTVRTSNRVEAVAFSSDGSSLTTDTERIFLLSPVSRDHSSGQKEPWNLFVVDQWVKSADQRLLWLPSEYRPSQSSAVSAWGNKICLGQVSGHVTILEFDLDSMLV